jgi:nicotinamidase-related amidase
MLQFARGRDRRLTVGVTQTMDAWDRHIRPEDRAVLERGRWARRGGAGERPALLVVDAQVYMAGERDGDQAAFPFSCGEVGWRAVDHMARLVAIARERDVPVVFTRMVIDPDVPGSAGVLGRKIDLPRTEGAFFRGTRGAEMIAALAPRPGELVLEKMRFSAFFGTPLLPHLQAWHVDTLVVTGGSTSNCVRASVVDAACHDFRVIVPAEAVFDRVPICHEISLFDMNRTYADVVPVAEAEAYLAGRCGAAARAGGAR